MIPTISLVEDDAPRSSYVLILITQYYRFILSCQQCRANKPMKAVGSDKHLWIANLIIRKKKSELFYKN